METLIEQLKQKKVCELGGIGILHKTDDNIAFTAAETKLCFYPVLPAERVVRKYAQHTVLIGEQEHIKEYNLPETTGETVYEEKEVKGKWKFYALIIAIAAVLMIVLYYVMYAGS